MAKTNNPSTAKPKADINFENDLWNAANELRGAVAENQQKDYVLSPGRYVGSEAEEDDGVPFVEKMRRLTTELAAHFVEGALLEKQIRENLKGIGFGL